MLMNYTCRAAMFLKITSHPPNRLISRAATTSVMMTTSDHSPQVERS